MADLREKSCAYWSLLVQLRYHSNLWRQLRGRYGNNIKLPGGSICAPVCHWQNDLVADRKTNPPDWRHCNYLISRELESSIFLRLSSVRSVSLGQQAARNTSQTYQQMHWYVSITNIIFWSKNNKEPPFFLLKLPQHSLSMPIDGHHTYSSSRTEDTRCFSVCDKLWALAGFLLLIFWGSR